jgi:hypothetical protein
MSDLTKLLGKLRDSLAQPTDEQIRAVLAAWDAAVA